MLHSTRWWIAGFNDYSHNYHQFVYPILLSVWNICQHLPPKSHHFFLKTLPAPCFACGYVVPMFSPAGTGTARRTTSRLSVTPCRRPSIVTAWRQWGADPEPVPAGRNCVGVLSLWPTWKNYNYGKKKHYVWGVNQNKSTISMGHFEKLFWLTRR